MHFLFHSRDRYVSSLTSATMITWWLLMLVTFVIDNVILAVKKDKSVTDILNQTGYGLLRFNQSPKNFFSISVTVIHWTEKLDRWYWPRLIWSDGQILILKLERRISWVWPWIQDASFGSPKDLNMQIAMDAMDQLYGHNAGNLNVLEKWFLFENLLSLNKCYINNHLLYSSWKHCFQQLRRLNVCHLRCNSVMLFVLKSLLGLQVFKIMILNVTMGDLSIRFNFAPSSSQSYVLMRKTCIQLSKFQYTSL